MENTANGTGKKPLIQYFGLTTGIILVISSIVGSGVYKKIAPMAMEVQSPEWVLVAWVLAGLVSIFGCLTVAEIAMLLPVSGGTFTYLKAIYGEKAGYYFGWSSFAVIQSSSTASIAYVFAQSLHAVYPLPILGGEWETLTVLGAFTPFANLGVKLVAVALIVLLTLVNIRGVKEGGMVSNVITVIVLVSLLLIALLGVSLSDGSISNVVTEASTYPPPRMSEPFGFFKLMFLAMLGAFWAYEGWMNVGYIGDEVKDPQRNLPKIFIFGILAVITLYLIVNFVYLYVVPMDQMIAIAQNENSIAAVEVIRSFLGNGGAFLISLLIVITTAGCTNATILTTSRIYYAMADKGLFFKKAAIIHPRFHTPVNALIMFGIWSSVLVFSGTFDQLTDMMVFSSFIFYGLTVAGVFVLRKKMPDAPRPYKTLGYPVVPVLFLLFCVGLLGNTLMERPREAVIGLFLILLGTPFYYWFKKKYKQGEG